MRTNVLVLPGDAYALPCTACANRRKRGEALALADVDIRPANIYVRLEWGAAKHGGGKCKCHPVALYEKAFDQLVHGEGHCLCHPVTVKTFRQYGNFHPRKECYSVQVKDPGLLRSIGAKLGAANRDGRVHRKVNTAQNVRLDTQWRLQRAFRGDPA